jgi:ferredoxin-NADP reductase
LTIGHHEGGLVSNYLFERARRGMVVGLAGVGGDFVLPTLSDHGSPRWILFVSGGSGITPVMAMLRTLVAEGHDGHVAFVHYARNAEQACYRDDLAALPGVRVLHGYTRSDAGDLVGRFGPEHLAAAMPSPNAVFVCGPTGLVEAVREHCDNVYTESFVLANRDVLLRPRQANCALPLCFTPLNGFDRVKAADESWDG